MVALNIKGNDVQALWLERGLADSDVARETNIEAERLTEIVAQNSANVTEIQKIADALKLTLTDILVGSSPARIELKDFRTKQSKLPKVTPELYQAIETMTSRMQFLKEEDLYSGIDLPEKLLGAVERGPKAAARILRLMLKVDSAPNSKNAYICWKTRIELLGVIFSTMPLGGAARGLAIYDAPSAAIIIASEEKNEGAKLFSLLHEFAHICRHESAISDHNWSKKTERWCNKFAAHALMPEDQFRQIAEAAAKSGRLKNDYWSVLRDLAEQFSVSLVAVAYHLDNLKIGDGSAAARYAAKYSGTFLDEIEANESVESGGGRDTHFYTRINDFGLTYIASVARGLASQSIDKYEVADALGIKFKYIEPLFDKARARARDYAA